jgi:molybdate transport system regulatory protein
MGMSYRRAWLLVDEMNKLFAEPVVAKWQGGKSQGGASLTAFGVKLVDSFVVLRERSNDVNRELLSEIGRNARTRRGATKR